jgi:putative transposase
MMVALRCVSVGWKITSTCSSRSPVRGRFHKSSKWLKTKGPALADFHWQNGYGIFSVSQSNADEVVDYMIRQEEHHQTMTFQQELRRLLERYEAEYDERYVWD